MHIAERIAQILDAISQEGPLPADKLVDRLPGIDTTEYVARLVKKGVAIGALEWVTSKEADIAPRMVEGRGNASRYAVAGADAGCVVGLNIGRTYFSIGAADACGQLISAPGNDDRQIATYERDRTKTGEAMLEHTAKKMCEWLDLVKVDPSAVRGVTLSLPAPVSTTQSKLLTTSIEVGFGSVPNIESFFKVKLGPAFTKLQKVVVANDADIAARGEVRYGNAHGRQDVVVVHAAYGVGAGIITEGSVLRTGAGGGVGEIGHCMPRISRDDGKEHNLVELSLKDSRFECACRHVGHLEALAGGTAIVRRVKESTDVAPPPPPELADLLANSESSDADLLDCILRLSKGKDAWPPGVAAMGDAAHLIGWGIHALTHIVKAEAVYLSGKLSEAGPDFLDEVRKGFHACGPLGGYVPEIAFGAASDQEGRRLIMVRGAAMTAARATESLLVASEIERQLTAVEATEAEKG
jgi:predicted NBD/HSP70 family sugar kinase